MVHIDHSSLMTASMDGARLLKSRGAFGWASPSLSLFLETAAEIVTPASSLLGELKVDMAEHVSLDVAPSLEETAAAAMNVDGNAIPLTLSVALKGGSVG